jgi:hypothetical protein
MTVLAAHPLPHDRWPRNALALLAASLPIAGIVLYGAFTTMDSFRDGLLYMFTLGLPVLATLFLITFLLARFLVGRASHRPRLRPHLPWITLFVCSLAGASLAVAGYHESHPLTRFRAWVLNPIPASVHNLQVNQITSFGGPSGMIFRFTISDQDLSLLLTVHHLQALPDLDNRRLQANQIESESVTADDKQMLIDALYPEEAPLRTYLRREYTRPANAQFYSAPSESSTLLVRDADTGFTTLLLLSNDPHAKP